MDDNEVVFDGSGRTNVDCFIFYFENVAEANTKGEQQPWEVIQYLRGRAFPFYYHTFTTQGELTDKAKDYELVKQALKPEFGMKKDLQVAIEAAISLKTIPGEDLSVFLEKADAAYGEVKFTDKR